MSVFTLILYFVLHDWLAEYLQYIFCILPKQVFTDFLLIMSPHHIVLLTSVYAIRSSVCSINEKLNTVIL